MSPIWPLDVTLGSRRKNPENTRRCGTVEKFLDDRSVQLRCVLLKSAPRSVTSSPPAPSPRSQRRVVRHGPTFIFYFYFLLISNNVGCICLYFFATLLSQNKTQTNKQTCVSLFFTFATCRAESTLGLNEGLAG